MKTSELTKNDISVKRLFPMLFSVFIMFIQLICSVQISEAQRLLPFTTKAGSTSSALIKDAVPYPKVLSVFDAIPESLKPDYFYVYFMQLPGPVEELGIRFLAPAPPYYYPFPGDVVTPEFESASIVNSRFLPNVKIEVAMFADSTTNFTGQPVYSWIPVGETSSNSERHADPSGSENSAMIRLKRSFENELIRITINDKAGNPVSGKILMQIGTYPGYKNIRIGNSIEALKSE
ncbi:MAG: hypothetical protein IPL74_16270 [Bacteroidetes bacterium]|nr:hypothetical protein [Bacteroidota bacterium]